MAHDDGSKSGGRKKGSLNKKTIQALDIVKKHGIDPFEILILFAKGDYQALGLKKPIPPEMRQKSATAALPYIYPQLKSTESTVTADVSNTFKKGDFEKYVRQTLNPTDGNLALVPEEE